MCLCVYGLHENGSRTNDLYTTEVEASTERESKRDTHSDKRQETRSVGPYIGIILQTRDLPRTGKNLRFKQVFVFLCFYVFLCYRF